MPRLTVSRLMSIQGQVEELQEKMHLLAETQPEDEKDWSEEALTEWNGLADDIERLRAVYP